MGLTITVDLLNGSFDAGDADDRRQGEWPPHPARVFCALVAAARTPEEREALEWLEAQAPPVVRAAEAPVTGRFSSYVVTNEISGKGGSQTHPGRSNQLRNRARVFPSSPRVQLVWAEAHLEAELVERIDVICRRVPYLGRSTGVASVAARAEQGPDDVGTDSGTGTQGAGALLGTTDGEGNTGAVAVFEPCDQLDGEAMVRVPYRGYLAELDDLYEHDRPAWQASRYLPYRVRRGRLPDREEQRAEPSAYRDVVVLRFSSLRPEGRLTARFTEALRARVLRAAGAQAPTALHGHDAEGRPHVAFLALPNIDTGSSHARGVSVEAARGEANRSPATRPRSGREHADGHLLGLAVAVPDLPEAERRAILAAVLGLRRRGEGGADDTVDLQVTGIGGVELRYDPGLVRPWGATPERWRQGSTHWVSATPVLLDRFPKRGDVIEDIVRASVLRVGLPDPVEIEVSTSVMAPGAIALRPTDLPDKYRTRLFRHVSLTFERPVAGPVLVGAGRYLGIGLFAPVHGARSARTVEDASEVRV
jgi:CRISPR-associated protein Csb2